MEQRYVNTMRMQMISLGSMIESASIGKAAKVLNTTLFYYDFK